MQIESFTSGTYPDPDGYSIDITGQTTLHIPSDSSLLISDLKAGTYDVAIGGLGSNCTLRGAPNRSVEVVDNDRAIVRVEVFCPTLPEECRAGIDLAVSGGTTPEFTWNPACRITLFSVAISDQDASRPNGTLLWELRGPPFAGPLQYGVAPPGVTVESAPLPLIAGEGARVFVTFEDSSFPLDVPFSFTP